jgi:hypothetical protein
MGGTSKLAFALALAMLAIGLSACGGGDDSTQSSNSTTSTAQATTPPPADAGDSGKGKPAPSDDKGGAAGEDSERASSDDSSSSASGEGSAAFRTPGGDNSIQNFGDEADTAEVDAATAALTAYLQARAKDDWARECALLAKSAVAPLEQLASRSPQLKSKGCAAILTALVSGTPASSRANPMTDGVASLRFDGDRGFALFHGAGGVNYFVPMVKEDGEWRVGALAPSEFP